MKESKPISDGYSALLVGWRQLYENRAEAGRVVKTPGGLFTLARGAGAAGG